MQLISKQITHPYICSGLGYLAWQLSRAMLFQWGRANRKSPVRQLSAATSSVWRTLFSLIVFYPFMITSVQHVGCYVDFRYFYIFIISENSTKKISITEDILCYCLFIMFDELKGSNNNCKIHRKFCHEINFYNRFFFFWKILLYIISKKYAHGFVLLNFGSVL